MPIIQLTLAGGRRIAFDADLIDTVQDGLGDRVTQERRGCTLRLKQFVGGHFVIDVEDDYEEVLRAWRGARGGTSNVRTPERKSA